MFRRLAFALAVLVWMVPAQVFALGLGNIEMRSALNQPLDARIELLRAKPGEINDVAVSLATVDTFKRAGIDRPAFLSELRFEVITNPGGTPYIQARSTQPITEAFLNFLIEVNWPNGRLLREFTVLVDPPVVTDRAPAAMEAPALTEAPAVISPEGQLVDQLAAEAMGQAPTQSSAIEVTRPVQTVEAPIPSTIPAQPTIQEPAAAAPIEIPSEFEGRRAATRPERPQATVRAPAPEPEPETVAEGGTEYGPVKANDTLWEIAQKTKPRNVSVPQMMIALLENNPEAFVDNNINNLKQGAVLRLSDSSVATSVSKEEAARITDLQWEQWKNSRGTMVGSTPSRAGRAPGTVAPSDARVKLVSPDASGEEAGGGGAPSAAAASGGRDAARLKRDLSVAQESLDAQRRETQEMRERVSSLEEQIATMQRLVQLKDDQLASMQVQAGGAAPESKPLPTEAVAAPGAAPESAPAPSTSTSGLVAGLMNDPKLIGLAVVVGGVLVLMIWLFVRRRKMQQFQESILTLNDAVSEPATGHNKPESEDASFMSDFAVSSMEGIQTEISEVDPLSEADVYLAYGRYKQAEELINQAIEKDPQRAELKMKLLEIYYAAKDGEAFELQAEMVHGAFSAQQPEMWARVLEMGRELSPENPMFGGEGGGASIMSGKADEFDLGDLNFGEDAALPQGDMDDLSLDFDLSEESSSKAPVAAATPKKKADVTPSDDNALDFDLGDLNFDNDAKTAKADNTAQADRALDFDLDAFDKETNESPAEMNLDAVADDNALDFDFSSFGKSDDKAKSAQASIDASDSEDNDALDFDFTPSPKNSAPRDAKVVEFNSASMPPNDDMLIDQPSSEVALADGDIDAELDNALFADVDEVGTKLDLAKAYIDMGDSEGARSILDEVMEEGDATQKEEAQGLMRQIG